MAAPIAGSRPSAFPAAHRDEYLSVGAQRGRHRPQLGRLHRPDRKRYGHFGLAMAERRRFDAVADRLADVAPILEAKLQDLVAPDAGQRPRDTAHNAQTMT